MKNIYLLLIIAMFTFVSCKNDNQESFDKPTNNEVTKKISGQELFEGEGNCIACHKPDQKIIGPSLQEIAKIYKEKNASIVLFLKEESDPIIDPSQYDIMKTNFAITKSMSDDQLKALEDYIYTFSK
ncbi:c-type cytochrome [Flavobacterium sp. AS60]|uniref:c-type cytochrome n=1 Tax=Flavobacterium anseongense TaxID=2910677 RepID=UPI001F3E6E07|nr:c-type cytochrome [Flavobacterium sp. AS60]MCF6129710.1 c-type cytochrome [Flavobacterium sp. AS60]